MTLKGRFLREIVGNVKLKKNDFIFKLKRRDQVLLTRLRIGHVGVRSYLKRFSIVEEDLCEYDQCYNEEVVDSLEHYFLYCPAYQSQREVLKQNLRDVGITNLTLKVLFAGEDRAENGAIVRGLMQFIRGTGKQNIL